MIGFAVIGLLVTGVIPVVLVLLATIYLFRSDKKRRPKNKRKQFKLVKGGRRAR